MKAAMVYTYAGAFAYGVEQQFEVTDHYEDPKPYGAESMWLRDETRRIHPKPWTPYEYVDAVFANPPCAVFSPSSYTKGKGADAWMHDPRLEQHGDVVRMGSELDASVVVMESVRQSVKGVAYYRHLQKEYLPNHELIRVDHNAKYHGIPQNRPRTFWIYTSTDLDVSEPEEESVLEERHLSRPDGVPVRKLNPNTRDMLFKVPPGKALRPYWDYGPGVKGVPSTACRRLEWGKPTPSMSGIRGYVHPDEDRYITVEEMMELCGYPSNYPFASKGGAKVLEMCRAVLPPVASWIAKRVREGL